MIGIIPDCELYNLIKIDLLINFDFDFSFFRKKKLNSIK